MKRFSLSDFFTKAQQNPSDPELFQDEEGEENTDIGGGSLRVMGAFGDPTDLTVPPIPPVKTTLPPPSPGPSVPTVISPNLSHLHLPSPNLNNETKNRSGKLRMSTFNNSPYLESQASLSSNPKQNQKKLSGGKRMGSATKANLPAIKVKSDQTDGVPPAEVLVRTRTLQEPTVGRSTNATSTLNTDSIDPEINANMNYLDVEENATVDQPINPASGEATNLNDLGRMAPRSAKSFSETFKPVSGFRTPVVGIADNTAPEPPPKYILGYPRSLSVLLNMRRTKRGLENLGGRGSVGTFTTGVNRESFMPQPSDRALYRNEIAGSLGRDTIKRPQNLVLDFNVTNGDGIYIVGQDRDEQRRKRNKKMTSILLPIMAFLLLVSIITGVAVNASKESGAGGPGFTEGESTPVPTSLPTVSPTALSGFCDKFGVKDATIRQTIAAAFVRQLPLGTATFTLDPDVLLDEESIPCLPPFAFNAMNQVQAQTFVNQVRNLQFNRLGISAIANDAFSQINRTGLTMANITQLGLSFNTFSTLPTGMFNRFFLQLKEIFLMGNTNLISLEDGVFDGLSNGLNVLAFNQSAFIVMPPQLKELGNIDSLIFDDSSISQVGDNFFAGLLVNILSLNNNPIVDLEDGGSFRSRTLFNFEGLLIGFPLIVVS